LIDGDAGSTPTVEPSLDDTLKQIASAAARRDHLEQWIRARVATVLGRAAARIELDRPLRSMGLDSLLGLQLRTELEKATGLKLPATVVWNYPTVTALAQHLADRLEISLDEPAHQPAAGETDLDDLFKEIAALPEEEVRRLLAERM
jgi:acyl carrier protein